ncbi:MAG: hypothetical protein KJ955_03785 [Nanoarchaeota archaeon]|nr:hypothetical protein [Nanoarchaeota archaeon]
MELKKLALVCFVISGIAALIYEVAWTRPLQMIMVSTVYTASILFGAFMLGLALGALIMSRYSEKIKNPLAAYGLMEIGIGLYGILLIPLFNILPDAYRAVYSFSGNFYLFEAILGIAVFILILIPTTLMGATFPLIAKYITGDSLGKGVGLAYSANNIGAIIGSLAAGFLMVPLLGIKSSIIVAAMLNLFVASAILFNAAPSLAKKAVPAAILLFFAISFFVHYDIQEMHSSGYYAGAPKGEVEKGKVIFYEEGAYGTIAVKKFTDTGGLALFINGKGQGSNMANDWRVNILLASLPLIYNPESKNALVIGLGTGTTSGLLAESVDVTTVEIEPAILDAADHFSKMNHGVLENKRNKIVISDGRNYLLKSKEKYDIIIPEPSDPWQSFSAALFSKEFLELSAEHLNDNGLYLQWVPLYEISREDFRSFYKTFNSVFPYTAGFVNIREDELISIKSKPSELILIGSKSQIETNETNLAKSLAKFPESNRKDLYDAGIGAIDNIMFLNVFYANQIKGYAYNAAQITDDNVKLEFSTSRLAMSKEQSNILSDIETFKEDINAKRE